MDMKDQTIQEVVLNDEFIELCKLLKLADLVASGGEAKWVIANGRVRVNDQVETQKRRKIRIGDEVVFDGVKILPLKTLN